MFEDNEDFYQIDKKDELIKQIISKIVAENKIDSTIKELVKYDFIPINYKDILLYLINTIKEGKKTTSQYMEEKFGFIVENTKKEQHELVQELKEIYFYEKHMDNLLEYNNAFKMGDFNAYEKYTKANNKLNLQMQPTSYDNTHDEDFLDEVLEDITNPTKFLKSGFKPFDATQPELGQLVGILGSTGDGKSIVLQKINAMFMKQGYKTDHYTIELNKALFTRRMLTALRLCSYNEHATMDYVRKVYIKEQFFSYPKLRIVTLNHGTVTINKIERILQESRSKIVFIDYCQLLSEEFNAQTGCDVAKRLHELAVKYNCLIIMGLQTNNDGRKKKSKPCKKCGYKQDESENSETPELEHIKRVKELADDCDIVISIRSKNKIIDNVIYKLFKFRTIKHRNGVDVEAVLSALLNEGKWSTQELIVNGEYIKEMGEMDEFDFSDEKEEELSAAEKLIIEGFGKRGVATKENKLSEEELQKIF